ncbi:MAG TPA: hypothetical protein EYO08_07150 [Candidatus Marinimicrobia bacterium]|nr:hypothetical protein [Candidatus Neomarinimicrobiota bacterium]
MPKPARYFVIVLISFIVSCGIPVDDPNAVTKGKMLSELEGARLWYRQMKVNLNLYETALQKESLILISANLEMYKNSELSVKNIDTVLDRYQLILKVQKAGIERAKETPSPGQQQTYLERKEELKSTQDAVRQAVLLFHKSLAEGGFRLLTPKVRIREMNESTFDITSQMVKSENEINKRREAVAEHFGVNERKRKLKRLGIKLNEIEDLYAKVNIQRNKLEKIIRLTSKDLSRVDYYWIGKGFPDQKFDVEFEETLKKTKSLVVELSELLEL